MCTIYPLITHLTVHDVRLLSTPEETFIENLRKKIQNDLGTVLEVSKFHFSSTHPDIGNCKWKVTLDIPEIEDLDVFKRVKLPNDYFIHLPGTLQKLSVTFHCIRCKAHGHSQLKCPLKEENFIRYRKKERQKQDSRSESKPVLPRNNIKTLKNTIGNEEVSRHNCLFPSVESTYKKEIEQPLAEKRKCFNKGTPSDEDVISLSSNDGYENDEPPAKRPDRGILNLCDKEKQIDNFSKACSTTNCHSAIGEVFISSPSISTINVSKSSSTTNSHSAIDEKLITSPSPSKMNVENENQSVERSKIHSAEDSLSISNQCKPITDEFMPSSQSIRGNVSNSIEREKTHIINKCERIFLSGEELQAFMKHGCKPSMFYVIARKNNIDVAEMKKQLKKISPNYYLGTKEKKISRSG